MKIKSILAISAFAASMSTFAQTTPPNPKAGAKQSSRSTAEKESIRASVQEFHEELTAGAQPNAEATMPPVPAPRVEVAPASDGRSVAARREQLRKSVQRHAQRQKWADHREAVDEAQRARLQKRQARLQQNKAPNALTSVPPSELKQTDSSPVTVAEGREKLHKALKQLEEQEAKKKEGGVLEWVSTGAAPTRENPRTSLQHQTQAGTSKVVQNSVEGAGRQELRRRQSRLIHNQVPNGIDVLWTK